jgi:hypothetical protein
MYVGHRRLFARSLRSEAVQRVAARKQQGQEDAGRRRRGTRHALFALSAGTAERMMREAQAVRVARRWQFGGMAPRGMLAPTWDAAGSLRLRR